MSASPLVTVSAHTFYQKWGTNAKPVLLGCSNGQMYVVKGRQAGRALVNDHIVGRLGHFLEAPVPSIGLVDVPQALIDVEPNLQHMPHGLSHGSLWIKGCSERSSLQNTGLQENRQRFARLAILYSWAGGSDHQFIYQNTPPHIVHSVDHGHFFPNGPNWTLAGLGGAPPAVLDNKFNPCALTADELRQAIVRLEAVSQPDLAAIVAGVPAEWGLSADERDAMITYLQTRKDQLIQVVRTAT